MKTTLTMTPPKAANGKSFHWMLKTTLKPVEANKVKTINSNDDSHGSSSSRRWKLSSMSGCPTTPPKMAYFGEVKKEMGL